MITTEKRFIPLPERRGACLVVTQCHTRDTEVHHRQEEGETGQTDKGRNGRGRISRVSRFGVGSMEQCQQALECRAVPGCLTSSPGMTEQENSVQYVGASKQAGRRKDSGLVSFHMKGSLERHFLSLGI
jgi:hypothetical protein